MNANKKKTIIWVVIVVVVAIGFYFIGHGVGKASAASAATTARSAFAGRAGAGGFTAAGGAAGGGLVTGQIIAADSQSITLQLRTGSQIIFYSPQTTVTKTVVGSGTDLTVGSQVSITGSANSDGSLTATSIQIRPATTTPAVAQWKMSVLVNTLSWKRNTYSVY